MYAVIVQHWYNSTIQSVPASHESRIAYTKCRSLRDMNETQNLRGQLNWIKSQQTNINLIRVPPNGVQTPVMNENISFSVGAYMVVMVFIETDDRRI